MQLSIFSSEEPLANRSASPDSERDWMTRVATSCLPMLALLAAMGPAGWSGKTSPESFRAMPDETLEAFWDCSPAGTSKPPPEDGRTPESYRASRALTASHGECLTLSSSEFPSDAVVCSLSDVLETGDVPRRFYLSAKACAGILRRAEKRGKELPPQLNRALTQVAQAGGPISSLVEESPT